MNKIKPSGVLERYYSFLVLVTYANGWKANGGVKLVYRPLDGQTLLLLSNTGNTPSPHR